MPVSFSAHFLCPRARQGFQIPMWNIEQVEAEIMLAFFVIYYFLLRVEGGVGGDTPDAYNGVDNIQYYHRLGGHDCCNHWQ